MSNQQIAPAKRVERGLAQMEKQFKSMLPPHISTSKFLRAASSAVANTPDLQEANYDTIITACQKAATDGLIIDNKEAAIVTFNKNVGTRQKPKWEKHAQYMPMVNGIIKKARNSGQISQISAHVVYDNDEFEYELGLNQKLRHVPTMDVPGEMKCAYAIARLKDGSTQFDVMRRDEIEYIMKHSKSGWDDKANQPRGIWKTWMPEMWKKTALKRLAKYLPSSTDLEGIIEYDNEQFGADDHSQPDSDYDHGHSEPADEKPKKPSATKARSAILDKDQATDAEIVDDDSQDEQQDDDLI